MEIFGISTFNLLLWAVGGFLAGYIAHVYDKNRFVSGGILATSLFGAFGAIAGGYLSMFLMAQSTVGFSIEGFMLAIAAAMMLAVFFRSSFKKEDFTSTQQENNMGLVH